jgi:hypothetical protein
MGQTKSQILNPISLCDTLFVFTDKAIGHWILFIINNIHVIHFQNFLNNHLHLLIRDDTIWHEFNGINLRFLIENKNV